MANKVRGEAKGNKAKRRNTKLDGERKRNIKERNTRKNQREKGSKKDKDRREGMGEPLTTYHPGGSMGELKATLSIAPSCFLSG